MKAKDYFQRIGQSAADRKVQRKALPALVPGVPQTLDAVLTPQQSVPFWALDAALFGYQQAKNKPYRKTT